MRRPRIDPLPEDAWDGELRELIEQSWEGPAPGNANNLFRTFARRRDLFAPWGEFGRAVYNGRLSPRDRELLVLRVAWLAQCRFEWAFHEPLARRVGISEEEIRRIVEGPAALGWKARDAALLGAVDELYATSDLTDECWKQLERWYGEGDRIELVVVVGAYTLVAQLTNALRIDPGGRLPALPAHEAPGAARGGRSDERA